MGLIFLSCFVMKDLKALAMICKNWNHTFRQKIKPIKINAEPLKDFNLKNTQALDHKHINTASESSGTTN